MTISVITVEDGSMVSRVFYNFSDVLLESYVRPGDGFVREPIESLNFTFKRLDIGV